MSDMDVFRRWLDEKSAELTRLRSLVTKVEGERDAARAALAVAEGERLTLAHGYRELALSAGDLNEDEEVLMALAERIVAEERTKEGSENG